MVLPPLPAPLAKIAPNLARQVLLFPAKVLAHPMQVAPRVSSFSSRLTAFAGKLTALLGAFPGHLVTPFAIVYGSPGCGRYESGSNEQSTNSREHFLFRRNEPKFVPRNYDVAIAGLGSCSTT